MSALLLAVLLLETPPATMSASPTPASPTPSPSPSPKPKKRETLAEAAAKQPPASKKTPPPAKVLTNEDLDKAREGGAAVSVLAGEGAEPAPDEGVSAGERVVSERAPTEEESWRARAQPVHAQLKAALALVEQSELRLAQLRDNLRPGDPMSPFQLQAREEEIKEETERLEQARANAAAARQALTDLQDEARRAGIPARWLEQP